ncbi:MAG: substrate-binding domain-containing protein [Planctomycetota bacterium]|nr:substrate-binding domain-containing protein [Planctomycetota bacterium]
MSSGRSWKFLGILLVVAVFSAVGCNRGGDQPKRIIILTNGDDPFFDAMRAGMNDAGKDIAKNKGGYTVELDKNDGTVKGQIDKLKQYAGRSDIAGLAISVLDPANLAIADGMRALKTRGVKIITVDSDIDEKTAGDARFAYIGTDNTVAGEVAGKALAALKPEGGEFATFVGRKSQDNAVKRINGTITGAGPKFTHKETLGDEMDRSVARKNVSDALQRYPKLNGLVGIWAYNADAIAKNVGDRRNSTAIVVFDAAQPAIEHMANGKIDVMVVQNPYKMGNLAVHLLKALVEDNQAEIKKILPGWDEAKKEFSTANDKQYMTGLKVVVLDEKSPVKAELFPEGTEFLTLAQFKEWLAKYNLTSS